MKISSLTCLLAYLILFAACGGSSSKRLARGSYDSAIAKAVKILQKDPDDRKEQEILKTAYHQSLQESDAVIGRLLEQGNGMALVGVVEEYRQMNRNADLIRSLPHEINHHYHLKDHSFEIQDYTRQASDVLFGEGEALMQSPIKEDQRAACENFITIKRINPEFPHIDRWISEAEEMATSKILISVNDQSKYRFKDTLMTYLNKRGLNELNGEKWQEYYLFANQKFDGQVKVTVHKIGLEKSPTKSETHNYSKQIKDPKVAMDAAENTQKDAEGNEAQKEVMQTITAKVIQEDINYELVLRGTISYFDHYQNAEIQSEELLQKKTITRTSYQVSGNEAAIYDSMLVKIEESKKEQLPTEQELVKNQMSIWRQYVFQKIRDSKQIF